MEEPGVEEQEVQEEEVQEPRIEEPGNSGAQVSSSLSGPAVPSESPTLPAPRPHHTRHSQVPTSYPPTWGVADPPTIFPRSHARPNPWSPLPVVPPWSLSGYPVHARCLGHVHGAEATAQGTGEHHDRSPAHVLCRASG